METFARLFETSVGQVLVTKEYDHDDEMDGVAVRWEPVGHAAATVTFKYYQKEARNAVFDNITADVIERLIAGEGVDEIIEGLGNREGVLTEADTPSNRDLIRRVFLANGFKVNEGQNDLKPYVYDAGIMLIACVQEANS